MAEIELGPLSDRLSDEEIAELAKQMEKLGAPQIPRSDGEPSIIADAIDDDTLAEFNDRLDAHDLAAEIYLPIEFEGTLEVGGLRVASAALLVEVLEEVKDELDVGDDEDEDDDDDEDEDGRLMDEQLKLLWKVFHTAALAAVDKKLPLHIKG